MRPLLPERLSPVRLAPVPVPVAPPPAAAYPPPASPEAIAGAAPMPQGSYNSAFADSFGRSLLDAGVRLLAPIPDGSDAAPDTTRLYGPAPQEPPPARPMPSIAENKDLSPPLPVDIPNFAVAKDRAANGLQPFPDGIAWLQAHHYRTVLHVRAPGEDDSAARRQFEKHDLRYLSLEVSPNALTKDVVDQFNRIVTEESDLPLFVYDRDGALAGGLWYLVLPHGAGDAGRTGALRGGAAGLPARPGRRAANHVGRGAGLSAKSWIVGVSAWRAGGIAEPFSRESRGVGKGTWIG